MGIEVSFGNNKLDKSIAIFNMNPAMTCPSDKLGMCKVSKICYAKKAERQYPAVQPYRERQEKYWDTCTAEQFVDDLLEKGTYKAGAKKGKLKFKYLRVSEAGDFKGQKDLDKLERIAEMLKPLGVTTYCYTARSDLSLKKVKSLVVNGSDWKAHNSFTAVKEFSNHPKTVQCRGNCGPCKFCMNAKGMQIEVLNH
jgi:hypothetical protein